MFAHVPFAVAFQLLFLLLGASALSALVATTIAHVWREVTQAEYRYIEAHGGLRANMPWYAGLMFWTWNKHSKLETVVAIAASVVLFVAIPLIV